MAKKPVVHLSLLLSVAFMAATAWALGWPGGAFRSGWFAVYIVVGAVAHEGLHALGWMTAARISPRRFSFGAEWRHGLLYAHCDAPMSMRAYRVGAVLPGVVTGVAPWVAGLVVDDLTLALAGALLTAGAAGDVAVLWASRHVSPGVRVEDHPSEVGLVLLPGGGEATIPEGAT